MSDTQEIKDEIWKKREEDWLQRKWRPAVAVAYIVICTFDFIIFPVTWAFFLHITNHPVTAWNPLTLQGAGLFHASFGAILGVAAFARGQDKFRNQQYPPYDDYPNRYPSRREDDYNNVQRPGRRYDPPGENR